MMMNRKGKGTADGVEVKGHPFLSPPFFHALCHSLAYEDEEINEGHECRDHGVGDASWSLRPSDQNGNYGHNGDEEYPRFGSVDYLPGGQNHATSLHCWPFAASGSPFWIHFQGSYCNLLAHP